MVKNILLITSFFRRIAVLSAFFWCGLTSAVANEQLAYFCEVKAVSEVAPDGTMRSIKKGQNDLLANYIGSKFKIIKGTGEVDGSILSNQGPNVRSTTILDKGSVMQSYKVISVFGPNPSILYLQINDYGNAKGTGKYTFSGFKWQEFITGICN
jgi:hypothetical protein